MSFPALVGITGRAGVGKDTLAHYLHIMFGYHRYALAQPIKEALNTRFGWTSEQWSDRAWKEAASEQCGSGGVGQFSPRSWAQWLGTEVGRELHGEECWIRLMQREWKQVRRSVDGMVVSDIRFDNEAAAIRELGGVVVCVERSAAHPIAPHKSERGVSSSLIDVTVNNNSSIAEFLAGAFNALVWLFERPPEINHPEVETRSRSFLSSGECLGIADLSAILVDLADHGYRPEKQRNSTRSNSWTLRGSRARRYTELACARFIAHDRSGQHPPLFWTGSGSVCGRVEIASRRKGCG